MADEITDEILETFAIVAPPDKVASALKNRLSGLVQRTACDFSFAPKEQRPAYLEELRSEGN